MRTPAITLVVAVLGLALAPGNGAAVQVPSGRPVTVGLALSGGSAKGIAHVGVLRALERLGVRVDVVAGTSMGSVVGGLYALGLPVDSVEAIIRNANWSALIGDDTPRSSRFLDQRRLDERAILSVPLENFRVTLPSGAIIGSSVLRLLEVVTWDAATVRRFADLPRPFVAVATDLETGEAVPLREGVLSEALRASTGIPAVVEPFSLDGRLLVDGALSRNLPAADARALGADFVICSDVSDPLESAADLRSLLDVFSQVTALSMLRATREQRELCDVLIRPDVDGISPLAFEEVADWVMRGDTAVAPHEERLRELARRAPLEGPPPRSPAFLGDSVRIAAIEVEGSSNPSVTRLVRSELELDVGDSVDRDRMAARLTDLDATGLFGIVDYRLDSRADGVGLTVSVEERPRDRLAVGLRYDDEWRAALLFSATLHNALRYGSVARLDLRVGEETRIGASLTRRRGVTGRLGTGFAAYWSQSELRLPAALGGRTEIELETGRMSLGLAATRGTALSVEVTGEHAAYTTYDESLDLVSGALVLDHEALDRIDFPRSGADVLARVEWGSTDRVPGGDFTVASLDATWYIPLRDRLTADLGAWIGYERGEDLPPHRRFFLGGAHRSAVFRGTYALFQGLNRQEHSGRAVQVARVGLRLRLGGNGYLRAGVDIGAAREAWRFPLERPMTGWALTAGTGTPIGPVEVQLAKIWGDRHEPHVSVSVGRHF
jgi:NTE family protein